MSDEPSIEFTVTVREDGKAKFEGKLVQPLTADHKAACEAWLEMMAAGLRVARALRGDDAANHD